jgi:hypothetical protein
MLKNKLTQVLDFIKLQSVNILIILIGLLIFLKSCDSGSDIKIKPKRDTVWIHKDSVVYSKPKIINTVLVKYKERSPEYLPDTNYKNLVVQYNKLADKFLASNIYKDSLKIDSLGYVIVNDTISNNLLKKRSFVYNFKYPKVIEYIPEKKRNQIYYGSGVVLGDQSLQAINIGAILKTKKDHIWGVNVGINSNQQIIYSVQTYWKLSFRKNK